MCSYKAVCREPQKVLRKLPASVHPSRQAWSRWKGPHESMWGEAVCAEVWVCTGRRLVSQTYTWGGITVAECLCVCVSTLYMYCPRIHTRRKHVRKSVAGENSRRESEEDWGCVAVESSACLWQEYLHRHHWLAFSGDALQRNLALSVHKLECSFLLLTLKFVRYLCESVLYSSVGAVSYICL